MNMRLELSNVIDKLIDSEECDIKSYYGISGLVYKSKAIDFYTRCLTDIKDKMFITQWGKNIDKAKEYFKEIKLTEKEKEKYDKLYKNNIELLETLNVKILDSKYDFLSDYLDFIVTDVDVQDQILSLSDARVEIFKRLYKKMHHLILKAFF